MHSLYKIHEEFENHANMKPLQCSNKIPANLEILFMWNNSAKTHIQCPKFSM